MFSIDIANQLITVNQDCSIIISGEVSVEFGNTKSLRMGAAKNGVIGSPKYISGLGPGKPVNVSSSTVTSVSKGDIITIMAISLDGDQPLSVMASSIQFEYVDIL